MIKIENDSLIAVTSILQAHKNNARKCMYFQGQAGHSWILKHTAEHRNSSFSEVS